jgi:hypothetical protein
MIEDQTFCTSCKQWLRHDKRWCPLYPEVSPPLQPFYRIGSIVQSYAPGKKWSRCLVHTCFDNPVARTPEESPTYKDFP